MTHVVHSCSRATALAFSLSALAAGLSGCDVPPDPTETALTEPDEPGAADGEAGSETPGSSVAVSRQALESQAAAAFALPRGVRCEYRFGDSSFATRCYFLGPSTTEYRARVLCSDDRFRYGSWRPLNSGIWSTATCGNNRFVIETYVQFVRR